MNFYAAFPPPTDKSNPFQLLLAEQLKQNGWDYKSFNLSFKNLWKNKKEVSILYFHWPEFIWRKGNLIKAILGCTNFILKIYTAKFLGYKLVWSAHNVIPHLYTSLKLEVFMRKWIIRNFNLIIGHAYGTDESLSAILDTSVSGKYLLALHGIYDQYYRANGELTKENLKISKDSKVLLLMSNGKPYQGNESFLRYWLTQCDQSSLHLIVSGRLDIQLAQKLSQCTNTTVIEGFVPDSQMADLFIMADFVVMPYEKITTSGMYFLALTFDKAVIAPDISFFERHTTLGTAILYNAISQDYNSAMDKVQGGWTKSNEQMDVLKQTYSWEASAFKMAEAFNHLVFNSHA